MTDKGRFSLITGIGHCGTKWLTTVLHHPDQGVVAHHELAHTTSKWWWKDRQRLARDRGVGRDIFPKYWKMVDRRLSEHRHLIDSQSWCPVEAAKVAFLGKAWRVIYLVRNGIQQLHSIANVSTWTHVSDGHWLYGPFLQRYWEIAGRPHKPWGKWTRWEKLCLWWATNAFMPDWVREHFREDGVGVWRLEDLTTKADVLSFFVRDYGLPMEYQELVTYQQTDVNRKVKGDRSPEALWKAWTSEQREAFKRICGKGMRVYGYEVPS